MHRVLSQIVVVGITSLAASAGWNEPLAIPPERTLALDAVSLVDGRSVAGKAELFSDRFGYRYLFSTPESKAAFEANPEKYEIQLGGACGKMGPLSGRGGTELHAVYEGKIYLFASEGCRETFLKDPSIRADHPDPKPSAAPEAIARGQELLALMMKGLGGGAAERVDAVKSIRLEGRWKEKSGQKEYARRKAWTMRFPADHRLDDDWGEEYPIAMVSAGDTGFIRTASKVEDLNPPERWFLDRQFHRHPLVIARARTRQHFVAHATGPTKVEDVIGEGLSIWFDGTLTNIVLEPSSGHTLAVRFRDRGQGGAIGDIELRYAPPTEVQGLRVPMAARAWFNGQRWAAGDVNVQTATLDGARDADFAPASEVR